MDWVFCVSSTVSWWIWFIYLLLFGLCSRKYHFSFLNIIGWWSWLCCKCTIKLSRPQSSWKGASGSSFRSSFQEEAWKRYNRRMREEYEEEMERVERIRRMQSVFNRERNKYKKSYESWRQNDYDNGTYHHHFQRDDWYWKADPSYRQQRTNFRQPPRESGSYSLSHHYSVLGLDR